MHTPTPFAALAWLDAFERTGGRVLCDGRTLIVTLPPKPDETLIGPRDWAAIAAAAYTRDRRRMGLEP